MRRARLLFVAILIAVVLVVPTAAQTPPVVKVCGLLARTEVKRLIDGNQVFDMMAPEEEAIGTTGSSCNYPGVFIQVIPFRQSTIDSARKRGGLEAVAGVGDEAYFYNNRDNYAELYVKVGVRLLTLQRDIGVGQTFATVRPSTVALANALVAKLR